MPITGTTRVFLILGDPVEQVRAPEVFNHVFRRHGIDAVLVPAQVAAADLPGFVRHVFKARNIDGLWLAIPHKAPMVDLLDECDRAGRIAGAVNAVRRGPDGRIEGALFDGAGFVKALDHLGIAARGRNALVVGVGGGGVAVAAALAERGVRRLDLFDTAPGRAAAVAQRLRVEFGTDARARDDADPVGFDLVVNASPRGLKPDDPPPVDAARLHAGAAVVDIVMKNQPTALLRACHARGITAFPGFEMLVQQVPEYLSFFGYDNIARAITADASELRALIEAA
ncbi:MAG: shikimate dehydrogenase [Burkholderiaceae bacterium]|nr:shikimate dehydrogenase [Burkholderiaceae bacterium]